MSFNNQEHKSDLAAVLDSVKIEEDDDEGELIRSDYQSPTQISDELITMSTLAKAKWKNIFSLDVIKARNKPKEGQKKPKQAPFFLLTVAGFDIQFDFNDAIANGGDSKLIKNSQFENLTTFH